MTQRIDVGAIEPEGYRTLVAVESYLGKSPLDSGIRELVKLRASQLNGCAYCVVMHSRDARKRGESEDRLHTVVTWRETQWFDAKERAALAYTEAATHLGGDGVPDGVWHDVVANFDEHQTAALVIAVAMINLWNRIAVPTCKPPAAA